MCMLQILVACLKVLGKTPVGSGDTKRIYLSYILQVQIFYSPCLHFGTVAAIEL